MSLRGSKTTEAISKCTENKEIATLSLVARNDKKAIATQSLGGGRTVEGQIRTQQRGFCYRGLPKRGRPLSILESGERVPE